MLECKERERILNAFSKLTQKMLKVREKIFDVFFLLTTIITTKGEWRKTENSLSCANDQHEQKTLRNRQEMSVQR